MQPRHEPATSGLLGGDPGRSIVAVVLTCRGKVGLFKRSPAVCHDAGRWHCVTGYLDGDNGPWLQVALELYEETGLTVNDLDQLTEGPVLTLNDSGGGSSPWRVHTFSAQTSRRRLALNWEHDAHRWVAPHELPRFDEQVGWLGDVIAAVT